MIVTDELRAAVIEGVKEGRVLCFWNLRSRMFVMDCFCPGGTEGMLDADALYPYLWAPYFGAHGNDELDFTIPSLHGG